jgi:hypothetical protein
MFEDVEIIFKENKEKYIYSKFNKEIKQNVLSPPLHILIFGLYFNKEIKENVILSYILFNACVSDF